MFHLCVLLAIVVAAEDSGSWGNVLGNKEVIARDDVAVVGPILEFSEMAINEHWGRCRECTHVSGLKVKSLNSITRQVIKFTKDGKEVLHLSLTSWNGTEAEEPLLLGVSYELEVTLEYLEDAPAKSAVEVETARAFKTVDHKLTLFGDREGLFSMVRHTWQPTGAEGWEHPKHTDRSPLLAAWFGLPDVPKGPADSPPLSIVCYNIWNFNNPWPRRLELITRSIKQATVPDIMAFQEVRYDNAGAQLGPEYTRHQVDHLLWRMEEVGLYQVIWVPAMSYIQLDKGLATQTEGPVILTRLPVTHVDALQLTRFWPKDGGDEHQRLCLAATIVTEQIGKVNVLTTHLSLSDEARMNNVYEICQWANELERSENGGKGTILMGDLNMIPSDPAMQYLLGKKEFKGTECNFKDVWLTPGKRVHELNSEHGYTFNNLGKALEKRIDFVLVKGDIDLSQFSFMEVFGSRVKAEDQVPPSDHMGLRLLVEKSTSSCSSDEL